MKINQFRYLIIFFPPQNHCTAPIYEQFYPGKPNDSIRSAGIIPARITVHRLCCFSQVGLTFRVEEIDSFQQRDLVLI